MKFASNIVSENFLPIADALSHNIPNIPANIYQDNISTMVKAHSTIINMLNMPTQYESVLSNQYPDALVRSPERIFVGKNNASKGDC